MFFPFAFAYQRLPLSYGTPEALGAIDFFEVKVKTINVAKNGILLYTTLGILRLVRNAILE